MAWLTLGVWVITFLIALPLGAGLLQGRISLGIQALAVGAGLVTLIIYLSAGEPSGWVWATSIAGALGPLALSVGTAGLISDRESFAANSQQVDEHEALLAGVELPLLLVAVLLAAFVGLVGTSI